MKGHLFLVGLFFVLITGEPETWSWVSGPAIAGDTTSGPNPVGRGEPAYAYDANTDTAWMFGGWGMRSQSGFFGDLWKWQNERWSWVGGNNLTNSSGAGTTGNRHHACMAIDGQGSLWIFGGEGIDSTNTRAYMNDLWKVTPNGVFTRITGDPEGDNPGNWNNGGHPSARVGSACWFDSTKNTFNLFGGQGFSTEGYWFAALSDRWTWDVASGTWSVVGNGTAFLASSPTFPGGRGFTAWTVNNAILYVYGGVVQYNSVSNWEYSSQDLYKFDGTSWTLLSGKAIQNQPGSYNGQMYPGSRDWSSLVSSKSGSYLYLYGGWGYTTTTQVGQLSDFWRFDVKLKTWTLLSGNSSLYFEPVYGTLGQAAKTNIPGCRRAHATWNDKLGNVMIYAGYGIHGSAWNFRGDTWQYQPAASFLDDSTSTSGSGSSVVIGAAAGSAAGVVVLAAAIGAFIYFRRRSQNYSQSSQGNNIQLNHVPSQPSVGNSVGRSQGNFRTHGTDYAANPGNFGGNSQNSSKTTLHTAHSNASITPYTKVETDWSRGTQKSNSGRDMSPGLDQALKGMSKKIRFEELTLIEQIGEGGYGTVWRATWRGKTVAVKQMKVSASLSGHALTEFVDEGRLMESMKPHRNLVSYFGISCDVGIAIVTEYLAGGSLKGFLKTTSLTLNQQLSVMKDIASGMWHLSQQKIVHKDLAARNVLLTEQMEAKVCDFGLSRVAASGENNTVFTKAEVGPVKWMAPESLREKKFSTATDVYSFGVTCIEILTRRDPYPDISLLDFSMRVLAENLNLRNSVPMGTPAGLKDLVLSCLDDAASLRPMWNDIVVALMKMQ